ncbi:MAG TPA: PIG-L deacetylase family protein [Candidatus Limnocylindrales bacterium]|nr:PIG-L deacetylase family protein [Candidatus Limnocylindrales bacterium]
MNEEVNPSLHTDRPTRVMVIVAHPDDADFGPAATVAAWIDAGTVAHLVCCTSGDAGSDDASTDPLALARTREVEQRAAAAIIGYEEVTFLHRPDGALENDLALREQLVTLIRTFKPDAVLTMDPTMVFSAKGRVQHTDHRAAAMAAVDAVYPAARNAMAFPQLARSGLAPHTVKWLYLTWTDRPNGWIDTSATFERKLAALRAHKSQLRKPQELEQRMRANAAAEGAKVGTATADAFRILDVE